MNIWILFFPLVFWIYEVNCVDFQCETIKCSPGKTCLLKLASGAVTPTCEDDKSKCYESLNTRIRISATEEVCCPKSPEASDAELSDLPTGCDLKPKCTSGDSASTKPFCKFKKALEGDGTVSTTNELTCEGGAYYKKSEGICCIPFHLVEKSFPDTGSAFPAECEKPQKGCDEDLIYCKGKCEYKLSGMTVTASKCKDICPPLSCCLNSTLELVSTSLSSGLPDGCKDKVCSATVPCFGDTCVFSLEKTGQWKAECKDCDVVNDKCCIPPGSHFLDYTDLSAKPSNCTPVCQKGGNFNSKKFCKYILKGGKIEIQQVDNCVNECCLPPSKDLEDYDPKSKKLPEVCADSVCQNGGGPCFGSCKFSLEKNKVQASCEKDCNAQCCLKPEKKLDKTWGSKLPEACLQVCEEGGKNNRSALCKYVKKKDAIEVSFVDKCLNTECCLKPDKVFNNFKKTKNKLPELCHDSVCTKDLPCYEACEFQYENETRTMHIHCIDSNHDCKEDYCCLKAGPTLKKDFRKGTKLPNDCYKVCQKGGLPCLKKFCVYVKDETGVTVECEDDCPEKSICLAPSENMAEFEPGKGELPVSPSPSGNSKTTSTAFKRVKSNLLIIISVIIALRQ